MVEKEHKYTFVVYRDLKGGYRWRLSATTGETLAASPSGHRDKASCEVEMRALMAEYPEAEILDPTAKASTG